jgi:hypothetical protein
VRSAEPTIPHPAACPAAVPSTAPAAPAAPLASAASTLPRPPAAETVRLYAGDWAAFLRWCRTAGVVALPADPATVASYLGSVATLSHGALARRLAAIAQAHRQHGHAAPGADSAVRALLQAARRGTLKRRRPGPGQLARMAARCPGDLAGLRDRAVLLLAATGLGRSALVGLDAELIRVTAVGFEAVLAANQAEGRPARIITVPRDAAPSTCPVRALEDWLRASDTRFGPVFRKIDRWGNVEHRRLGTDAIRRILARRALRRAAKAGAA